MKFSEKLKQIRTRKGLRQREVAKFAGITHIAICQYERGRREPSLSVLVEIAAALDVSVDCLLGVEKEEVKRCPFCGGRPKVTKETTFDRHFVFCEECFGSSGRSDTEATAIEKWNRRDL